MPRTCCLCSTVSGVSFHGFPKNKKSRTLWKNICNYKEYDDVSNLHICSRHFLPSDYINFNARKFGGRLALKAHHFPSINVPNNYVEPEEAPIEPNTTTTEEIPSSSLQPVDLVIKIESSDDLEQSSKNIVEPEFPSFKIESVYTIKSESEIETNEDLEQLTTETNEGVELMTTEINEGVELMTTETYEDPESVVQQEKATFSGQKKRKFCEPRYLGDVTISDMRSPKIAWKSIQLAKEAIKKVQLKNKVLRAKNNRLMKKIDSLEEMINYLKKRKNFDRKCC